MVWQQLASTLASLRFIKIRAQYILRTAKMQCGSVPSRDGAAVVASMARLVALAQEGNLASIDL